jgi:hypothetical protein
LQHKLKILTFFADNYNDLITLEAPKDIYWSNIDAMEHFINVYDWDRFILNPDANNILQTKLLLCLGPLPCEIHLLGTGFEGANLKRAGNGSLVCMESLGCSGMYISEVMLLCLEHSSPALSAPLEIEGAVLELNKSFLLGCFSQTDGGSVKAYGGASVLVRTHLMLNT